MSLATTDEAPERPELDLEVDLYAVLRVARDIDLPGIHRAYRARAKVVHPDMPKGSAEAWKMLELAYAVLSDPTRRRIYDETGQWEETAPDNELADAMAALARMLQVLIEEGGLQQGGPGGRLGKPLLNAETNDLGTRLVTLLRGKVEALMQQRQILESRMEVARVMRLRFEFRAPLFKPDAIGLLLDREIEVIKQDMATTEAMAAPLPRAIELAQGYRYRADTADAEAPNAGRVMGTLRRGRWPNGEAEAVMRETVRAQVIRPDPPIGG